MAVSSAAAEQFLAGFRIGELQSRISHDAGQGVLHRLDRDFEAQFLAETLFFRLAVPGQATGDAPAGDRQGGQHA